MTAHSILRSVFLVAAAACLALGYLLIKEWLILLAIPAMILLWLATWNRSPFWAACSLLSIYVVLTVVGLTRHAPALLMSVGCVLAVATWDLSDPRHYAAGETAYRYGALLENRHLRSLAATFGLSLLLVALATVIRLQLPFAIVGLLVLTLIGCVLYAVHSLRRSTFHRQ